MVGDGIILELAILLATGVADSQPGISLPVLSIHASLRLDLALVSISFTAGVRSCSHVSSSRLFFSLPHLARNERSLGTELGVSFVFLFLSTYLSTVLLFSFLPFLHDHAQFCARCRWCLASWFLSLPA